MRTTFSMTKPEHRATVQKALAAAIAVLRDATGQVPDIQAVEEAAIAEDKENTPAEIREMGPLAVLIDAAADRLCQLMTPEEVFEHLQDTTNFILKGHYDETQKAAQMEVR